MALLRMDLLKTTYQWIVDQGFTPYLLVDAEHDRVEVPAGYVKNGKIVLNLSAAAVRNFAMTGHHISFEAGFGGVACQIFVPASAILALYAREGGQGLYARDDGPGLLVNEGDAPDLDDDDSDAAQAAWRSGKPQLKVIK